MPITEIAELKQALAEAGLRPNRALGQNFFIDGARLGQVVDAAGIDGMPVLEIGPGMGALTERLLGRASRVVAVEKDAAMADALRTRLHAEGVAETVERGNLRVETADILRFDIAGAMTGEDFAVAGNLPYYITTPIVERLLPLLPKRMTLMVQREAAERFFAAPSERVYGPVAVTAQTFYTPSRVMEVPRSCYFPQPEVDSSVVRLERADPLPEAKIAEFLAFLGRVFSMRRKTLFNNLSRDARVAEALSALGLPADTRAEAIAPALLLKLFFRLR